MLEDGQSLWSWNKDEGTGDQNVPVSNENPTSMLAHGERRHGLQRTPYNGHRRLTLLLLVYSQVKPASHRDAA